MTGEIVAFRDREWGGFESTVQVESIKGWEDFTARAQNIAGGGHGASAAPMWKLPGSWVLAMTVFAETDEQMAAQLDDLKAAAWGSDDPMLEDAFTVTMPGEEPRTAFCRVAGRNIPTTWATRDRMRHADVQLLCESTDPLIYGAQVEHEFVDGDTWSLTSPGWAASERWRWTTPGPVEFPRLTWSNGDVQGIVRLGQGSVPTGQNLVVDVKPKALLTTVGGPTFNRYGWLDGGVTTVPPVFFKIPPGAQTITYSAAGTGSTSTLRYRPAMP